MHNKKELTIEEATAIRESKVCKEWLKDMYAYRPSPEDWIGFWGTEKEWNEFCKTVREWLDKHKGV